MEGHARTVAAVGPEWLEENIRRFGTTAPPRPCPRVTGKWIFITPALAQHWIEHHIDPEQQRGLREHRVDRISSQMADGSWDEGTPQFIVFDENGVNADGQHRLYGIVESNQGQWFIVAWNVAKRARKNIDTHARRSAADNLLLSVGSGLFHGVTPSQVQSIARAFMQGAQLGKVELEAEELENVLVMYQQGLKYALRLWSDMGGRKSGLRRSMIGALAARAFYHVDESERGRLTEFFKALTTGDIANRDQDQAVMPFRDFLMANGRRLNSNGNAEIYLRGAAALLAFMRKERRQLNRALNQDPFPLPVLVDGKDVSRDAIQLPWRPEAMMA